jgi:hypothetical protein
VAVVESLGVDPDGTRTFYDGADKTVNLDLGNAMIAIVFTSVMLVVQMAIVICIVMLVKRKMSVVSPEEP